MNSFVCPHCGQEVKQGARSCPHCGSDKDTGWSDDAETTDTYSFNEEDYQDAVAREFGSARRQFTARQVLTAVVVLLVLALFILYMVK